MESSTRNNEKIGGHHVNKRKRKCTESKSFSNKAISLNSNSSKAKADDHLDVPTHAIGGDGHFYVCMKCEDVGQLICCDTCSCTYHLYCLDPPLESTPEGDWYCPNCSDNDNLVNPALNLENAISNKGLSLNKASNSSSHCSLCSKIEKILILNEDEVVISKPCSTDQPNLSVGFDKYAMEHRGEPSVPDAGIDGTIIQHTPNSEDSDKLLILRDVLQGVVQELGNTEQTNNEAEDTMNQLVPVDTQSGQLQKDKSAKVHSRHKEKLILRITSKGVRSGSKLDLQGQSSDPAHAQSCQVQQDENANLHSRQKGKLILRNTSKGAHSGSKLDLQKQSLDPVDAQSGLVQKDENANLHSRPKGKLILRNTRKGACSGSKLDVQKQSSDLSMVKYGESVRSDALANTIVADAQRSSVMTLSGQHVTTPSISLPPMVPNFPSHINADAQRSSLMTLSGQNITNPNISLPKTNALAASGFTSSMAYGKNIDTVPSGRPSGFLKRNAEKITWSGLELDALWVGVRRYGQEDWGTILADPSLRVLKNKTPQDLCMKWKEELPKIFSFQKPSSSLPSSVPAERLKPPVSNRKGIKTRDATTMQLLPPKFPFPSLKSGTLGSYDQGSSSSRASPSFPKAHDTDIVPPHWVPNLNMEPMVSELLFQTLKQRANPETKMRLIGMQAFPTPGVVMAAHRRSSSNRTDQTNLLLGGHFPIRNASGGPSNTKPNPSQVETDED